MFIRRLLQNWFPERIEPMWLIVGLGNPGAQYTGTRHNIGFECLDRLAERNGLSFTKKRAQADIIEGNIAGQRVVLAKPFTFMNLSGRSVVGLKGWYKIDPAEQLLVVYDDLDLPFGKIRIRERGSAGTHNGMRSIVNLMGSQEFPRLRIGIDRPPPKWDVSSYVLGKFEKEQQEELPFLHDRVADAIELMLREGLSAMMNTYNSG